MIKSIKDVLAVLWKTQKIPIVVFVVIQCALAIAFRVVFNAYLEAIRGVVLPGAQNEMMLFFVLMSFSALSALLLIAYLNVLFHPYSQQAWLRRLPISETLLFAIPATILLLYSIVVYGVTFDFWYHQARQMGASFALFGLLMPFTVFWFARAFRNPWVGQGIGVVVAGMIAFVHIQWLWFWYSFQWRFVGEMYYVAALAFILFALERQSYRFPTALLVSISLIFATPLLFPALRAPKDLGTAIADILYYPSETSVKRYKQFLADEGNWKPVDPQTVSLPSLYANRLLAERFLSPMEKTQFLRFVVSHHRLFEYTDEIRPNVVQNCYPLGPSSVTKEGEEYLMSSWKDEMAYCYFLPVSSSTQFMDKIFRSQCGGARLSTLDFWSRYQPERENVFDRTFEHYLLEAHDIASNSVKRAVMRFMLSTAKWNSDSSVKIGDTYLYESAIDKDLLQKWKSTYGSIESTRIKKLASLDRKQFESEIHRLGNRGDYVADRVFVEALCRLVSSGCDAHRETFFGESLPTLLRVGRVNRRSNDDLTWFKVELLRPEVWEKVQALRD